MMPASIASRMRSEVASVRPGTRSRAALPSESGTRRLTTGRPVSMTWMRRLLAGCPLARGDAGGGSVVGAVAPGIGRLRPVEGVQQPGRLLRCQTALGDEAEDPGDRVVRHPTSPPPATRHRAPPGGAGFGNVDVAALEGAQDVHARVSIRLLVGRLKVAWSTRSCIGGRARPGRPAGSAARRSGADGAQARALAAAFGRRRVGSRRDRAPSRVPPTASGEASDGLGRGTLRLRGGGRSAVGAEAFGRGSEDPATTPAASRTSGSPIGLQDDGARDPQVARQRAECHQRPTRRRSTSLRWPRPPSGRPPRSDRRSPVTVVISIGRRRPAPRERRR